MTRFALLLLGAASLLGHDLEVTSTLSPPAVVMRCAYSGTEPAAYAAVLVFGPGGMKTEFQNGRTDANGVFSFVPDRSGVWRFVVDDEIGHRREAAIDYRLLAPRAAVPARVPVWHGLGLGLALIAGITGTLYGWKNRRA
jgi:nickel transport protein